MSRFMLVYRAPGSTRDRMASATPEQQEATSEAWRTWAGKVGYAIADLGTPLAHTAHVGPGGSDSEGVCGYTILEASSADEVKTIIDGHPHLDTPGGSIEILELIPLSL